MGGHFTEDLSNPTTKMPDIKVSEAGIAKLLKKFEAKNAAGPDRSKHVVLQELRKELSQILKVPFECSLESGAVRLIWNSATYIHEGKNNQLLPFP